MALYQKFAKEAKKKLQAKRLAEPTRHESIIELMMRINPHLVYPYWLKPYLDEIERSVHEVVNTTIHFPPQVGKSTGTLFGLLWYSLYVPGREHAYVSFSLERAREVAKDFAVLLDLVGLEYTVASGRFRIGKTKIFFTTCGGGNLTGSPITGLLICDDLLSSMADATSRATLNDIWSWFLSVAQTRKHPTTSVLLVGTRWHEQDPTGRAIEHFKKNHVPFKEIRIAAICDSEDDPLGREIGDPMAPEYRPLEFYDEFKNDIRIWSALFQGKPRALGDILFSSDPLYYTDFPAGEWANVYGTDLAYSEKTRADWSVLIHGRLYTTKDALGNITSRKVYLTHMDREQVQADKFKDLTQKRHSAQPGKIGWFCSTTEMGTAHIIKQTIPGFTGLPAKIDKYARAVPTAEKLWNPGHIYLPQAQTKWREIFLSEVTGYSGTGGGHDDVIDALAALGHIVIKGVPDYSGVSQLNTRIRGALSPFKGIPRSKSV